MQLPRDISALYIVISAQTIVSLSARPHGITLCTRRHGIIVKSVPITAVLLQLSSPL